MNGDSGPDYSRWWLPGAWVLSVPVLLQPIANPDIFWHLAAGRQIAQANALPKADFFSYTMIGAPWIDFEWLVQLIYLGFHSAGGFAGLWALKIGLLALSAAPILAVADLHDLKPAAKAVILLFWSSLVLARSDLKPETFSVIFFSILLWILEARRIRKFPHIPLPYLSAGTVFFFSFWTNLHPAFPYGMALMFLFALDENTSQRKDTAFLLLSAFLGTLLNPYGYRIYEVLFEHARSSAVISQFILEWQPPILSNPYDGPSWILLTLTAIGYAVLSTKKKYIPLSHLTCAVFFAASFLLHSRQKAFFIPVGLLFITAAYEPCRKMLAKTPFDASRYLLLICLASYVAFIGKYGQLHFLQEGPVIESSMPRGACDFIEEHLTHFRKRRLFNQWGWGGYLEYRFHPELRVFMDGRYIFHDFLKIISGAHDSPILWQNFLTAHNIEWVLVRNDSRPVRVQAQIRPGETGTVRIPYLSAYYPSARWALLYRDFESVLYVRRGAFDAEWLNRREIR